MHHPEINPYAAPQSGFDPPDLSGSNDEILRRQYIGCEQEIISVGGLMVGGAFFCGLPLSLFALGLLRPADIGFLVALTAFCVLLPLQITCGWGLYRLRPWARSPSILFCALWLLFIPVGTIIGGAALWVLGRNRSGFVFSDEYRQVVSRTPHVRHVTPGWLWALLAAVIFVTLLMVMLFLR